MRSSLFTLVTLVAVVLAPAVAAEPPEDQDDAIDLGTVIVTATRTAEPIDDLGSSVTVITRRDIESSRAATVVELLRSVPGLDVVSNGGLGGATSVFIRGASSEHTLVLIDGMEVNDPMSPSRSFDFAHLTTADVERIEIVRGPQSTLYGSDALGGVVNIITRQGTEGRQADGRARFGTYSTYDGAATLRGGGTWGRYGVSASYLQSDGVSAASERLDNTEADGYTNTTVSASLTLTPTETFSLDARVRATDSTTDFDNYGGPFGDDPNATADSTHIVGQLGGTLRLLEGRWSSALVLAVDDHDRRIDNPTDDTHPLELTEASYKGRTSRLSWQNDLRLGTANALTLGLETQREEGSSDYYSESFFGPYSSRFDEQRLTTSAIYLQDTLRLLDDWTTTLGVRVDRHETFGTAATYRIATSYRIAAAGTRLKASLGTGFKAPSLFQLFSSFGNEELDAETSRGWDLGIEQQLAENRLRLGVTYFQNRFENLITYDFGSNSYANVAAAQTSGIELFLSARPLAGLTVDLDYTMTDTEDEATGKDLLRRPRAKGNLGLAYRFGDRADLRLQARYVGRRDDLDLSAFPAQRVTLASYTVVDLAGSFAPTNHLRLFGRLTNLFDKDYEEVLGYGTWGRAVELGLAVTL